MLLVASQLVMSEFRSQVKEVEFFLWQTVLKRSLQLHLYVLVSKLNKTMSFSVGYIKESFEKTGHRLVSFDVYTWNFMLKPEKFDVAMTEPSGITRDESWCIVYISSSSLEAHALLLNQYLSFQTASTIYSWCLSIKRTDVFFCFSCLQDILRLRTEVNTTCYRPLSAHRLLSAQTVSISGPFLGFTQACTTQSWTGQIDQHKFAEGDRPTWNLQK